MACRTVSIHALRVEGDRGHHWLRAAVCVSIHALRVEGDASDAEDAKAAAVSIHALRVEGDSSTPFPGRRIRRFLSTPSGWRATNTVCLLSPLLFVSIHALRVEGDKRQVQRPHRRAVSIHALRVEGDSLRSIQAYEQKAFLSTPSGWRATKMPGCIDLPGEFLSTPSGWRATAWLDR